MSHHRTVPIESTLSIISCTPDEFWNLFEDDNISTSTLANDALNVVSRNRERLREINQQYRLDDLLTAMLEHAPHTLGQRYVSVVLLLAQEKGEDTVFSMAQAWMAHLFLPMLTISKGMKTWSSGSQTSNIDTMEQHVDSANLSAYSSLRQQVASREEYRCCLTGGFDTDRARELRKQRRRQEIPNVPFRYMEATPIIPITLSGFNDWSISRREITDASLTSDMLQCWTQIDIKDPMTVSKMTSPQNAIYMTAEECIRFSCFHFYLDEDALSDTPDKYKVRMTEEGDRLSTGQVPSDVEFRTLIESGIEPPDPQFLRVHAAFAKVLLLCGAADYIDAIECQAEMEMDLYLAGEIDFGSVLASRLSNIVR